MQFLEPLTNELKTNPIVRVLWPNIRFKKGKDEISGKKRYPADLGEVKTSSFGKGTESTQGYVGVFRGKDTRF